MNSESFFLRDRIVDRNDTLLVLRGLFRPLNVRLLWEDLMPPVSAIRSNRSRMKHEFEAQAHIGRYGKTGLARVAFTRDYNQVRNLFRGWMEKAGLKTRIDAVGNLFGRKEGRVKGLPPVMTGSHLDSIAPAGGRFDGTAGVLTALEAVRRIAETGAEHDHPLEVVGFIGEEGSYGLKYVLGSSILAGLWTGRLARQIRTSIHPPTGKTVYEAARASGEDPSKWNRCRLPRGYFKAFIELHVEQGPVLEDEGVSIGIVDVIAGYRRGEIAFQGVAAHGGGQPMDRRKDAAMAAADFMLEMEGLVRRAPECHRMTLTFGRLSVQPGGLAVVPGGAVVSFDLRTKSAAASRAMFGKMKKSLVRIRMQRGVKSRMRQIGVVFPPCAASPGIRRALRWATEKTGYPYMALPSGGLHDACRMSRLGPIGMVFVPSAMGLSHTPAEFTRMSDLAAGAEVLAAALLRLADRGVKS